MKRILFSAAFFAATFLSIQPVFSYTTPSLKHAHNVTGDKDLDIMPDRVSGEMKVRFKAVKASSASLEVIDEAGKVVLKQTAELVNGMNDVPIVNSMKLNEGTYTLRFVTNNHTYSSSFLIWK
ncbi:MAG: T9SS type A sorting domain-containing protein [Ferruginibacter sp.]|nr:T9SS type A sorting domain-containing protein [Ferruginibacter sp.]